MTILLFGGYGGTGTVFARLLLNQLPEVRLIIAGRKLVQAQQFSQTLQKEFPGRDISARYADASLADSLLPAFEGVNLIVITATVPEQTEALARAALACGADWFDIFVSTDPLTTLQNLEPEITRQGKVFITQGGFHPGLCAPLIRHGSRYFDRYDRAIVGLTMNFRFPKAASAREIILESYGFHSEILKNGGWKAATYNDMLSIDFGEYGKKICFPMNMPEIKPLQETLGVRDMGVYVSGFNWFVDYVVFSLIYLAGKIRKGLFLHFFERLMKWGIDVFSPKEPWLRIQLDAEGLQRGQVRKVSLCMENADGYFFTAACMIACIKQYTANRFRPGLHLMGVDVEAETLFDELKELGIEIKVKTN